MDVLSFELLTVLSFFLYYYFFINGFLLLGSASLSG